jgi:hypothetical protein
MLERLEQTDASVRLIVTRSRGYVHSLAAQFLTYNALTSGFESESRVTHIDAAPRLGQRAVRDDAGDDMFASGDGLVRHLDPL